LTHRLRVRNWLIFYPPAYTGIQHKKFAKAHFKIYSQNQKLVIWKKYFFSFYSFVGQGI